MNKIEAWAQAVQKHEGYYPGSRSYRNHNPGNFRCSGLVMGELGAIRCDDNFAVFPDFETGWAALVQFLTYAADGSLRAYNPEMTLYEFYAVYAPGGDGNYPKGYAESVANDLGLPATTKIGTLLTYETMFYTQKGNTAKLGTCSDTIEKSGCFITAIANFMKFENSKTGYTPTELNDICKREGFYTNGCMLNAAALADYLGYEYSKQSTDPNCICIAETNAFKVQGVPQHFFLFNPMANRKVDSLDANPQWKDNYYNIVSYRVFKLKSKETMATTEKLKKALKEIGLDFGDNLNEGEMDKLADEIEELYDKNVELLGKVFVLENKKTVENSVQDMTPLELIRLALKKFIA